MLIDFQHYFTSHSAVTTSNAHLHYFEKYHRQLLNTKIFNLPNSNIYRIEQQLAPLYAAVQQTLSNGIGKRAVYFMTRYAIMHTVASQVLYRYLQKKNILQLTILCSVFSLIRHPLLGGPKSETPSFITSQLH